MKHLRSLLQHKQDIYAGALRRDQWNHIAAQFLLLSILSLALFGVVVATRSFAWDHMLQLSWKMIALIWGSLTICTPSLFVFSAIRGSRLSFSELVYLLLGALATTGIVLISLTPVVWFFTWTSETLEFVKAMNIFVVGLSLSFGLYFLTKGVMAVQALKHIPSEEVEEEPVTHSAHHRRIRIQSPASDILLLWFILFLVVVVQMAHKLGPWYVQ